jgi:hypothetical protein
MTDEPVLYAFSLLRYIAPCLQKGGEITVLFGSEVQSSFLEAALTLGRVKVEPLLSYKGPGTFRAERWIYDGMTLTAFNSALIIKKG